jgi:hypothetical protein
MYPNDLQSIIFTRFIRCDLRFRLPAAGALGITLGQHGSFGHWPIGKRKGDYFARYDKNAEPPLEMRSLLLY